MSLLPRLRMLLARRPWLYWLVVGICALAVWLSVASAQAAVTKERAAWGTTRAVWVASGTIAAGDALHAAVLEYPSAMVPAGALSSLPPGALAARSVADGEVLVAEDLAVDGLVPPGWVVFAVPLDGAPSMRLGDALTVFGSGQAWCDGIAAATNDTAIDVAVPDDCAGAVSAQLALGAVTLARRP